MIIVGIDEVGRGCWAGPLVAGAVALENPILGLRDSKKLSKKQREMLAALIRDQAAAVGIGWVSAAELDVVGLTEAVRLAMERALKQIRIDYDEVVIDGNINYFPAEPRARALVKADDIIPAVSAASIVAKVARDNYMAKLTEPYARYGFDRHVGYGTTLHIDMLKRYGVSDLHRRSFKPIRLLLEDKI